MEATVVITTKNRLQELRGAISSALAQTAQPEILVIDDGSTDGTAQALDREFPSVTVDRSEISLGLIAQRNRAAMMCKSPIVFSIDDDAIFSTPRVVEQTLREFNHSRVGAVAIPFRDVCRSPAVQQKAPEANGIYASYGYIGTAHAVRRDLFLKLSGYREPLFHQGEEEDYCIRLLAAGYFVRAGNADPIYHYESPRRSWTRMDFYGSRNKILYTWFNVPFPYFPGHMAATTAKTLSYSLSPKRFWIRLKGVLAGFYFCAVHPHSRQPVSPAVYRLSRMLKKRGDLPFGAVERWVASNGQTSETLSASRIRQGI